MQFWPLEYYHLWACHALVSPGEKENGWLEMYTKAWQSLRKWECPIVFMNHSFQDQTLFTWPSQHFNWLLEFGANSKRQLKEVLLGARQIRPKFIVIFPFCFGQLHILRPSDGVPRAYCVFQPFDHPQLSFFLLLYYYLKCCLG